MLNDTFDRPESRQSELSSNELEFIDFLKNIEISASQRDPSLLEIKASSEQGNLLQNLNYLKACFESYKKSKPQKYS